jgi:phenylpyruvate tautomerase PptA (4-oxalocrotonate tautomerase family)
MLRNFLSAVVALAILAGGLVAADKDKQAAKQRPHLATFVSADVDKGTLTFKVEAKQLTLPLAEKAKILGEDNKPETLKAFVDNMKKEPDKTILIIEDVEEKHIAFVKDVKSHKATFVSADVDQGTLTFKVGVKEHTLPLAKHARILGEDNKPETLKAFMENMKKEPDKTILIIEDAEEKHVVFIRDVK